MRKTPPPKIEIKNIKHTFTETERNGIGSDLARAIAALRGTTAEFDQVKAGFKARITEGEAKIDNLSTALMNGFEMRSTRCEVVFRPKDKEKDYYFEGAFKVHSDIKALPVLTEPMTDQDFQTDLLPNDDES